MFFVAIASVSAIDSLNAQDTEDSNLMADNDDSLSTENKLEISSDVSISETNIVNSHDDNLGNYPNEDTVESNSYYEDNGQEKLASIEVVENNTESLSSSSTDAVVSEASTNNIVSADSTTQSSVIAATPTSTKLSISDAHYCKSATYFDVTLKDKDGNAIANQKVSLKVNKKLYSAYTDANGIASIKTASLAVGSYAVSLSYGGSTMYSSSSLSKKVKVLSSVSGSDLTKYTGYTKKYKVTFWKDNAALANTKVTYKIVGKSYTQTDTVTTDENGVATIKVKLLAGKFTITMENPYSKEKASYKIVVKKDKTALQAKAKTYVIAKNKGKFSVVLKTKHGKFIADRTIHFTYNNKKVTSKTDANGKATITIPVLAKGTYKISYSYGGSKNYRSSSGSSSLVVCNPTTKLSASNLKMEYNDSTKFKVKLTTVDGKALVNKTIKVKINGKTLTNTTNSKGKASFSLNDTAVGKYNVKYYYSSNGLKDYSHGSSKITIKKQSSKIIASDLEMSPNNSSVYQLTVKDKSGNLLKGVFVKTLIDGRKFYYQTNDEGIAKLKVAKDIGYYKVKSKVVDPCYTSDTVTKHIIVKGFKFKAKDAYVGVGSKTSYSVKVLDEKNKPVKNALVSFVFNGKNLSSKTNSKGIAQVSLKVSSKGTYKIKYSYESFSGSSKIFAVKKVTIKEILTASKSVKKYISKHSKLPSSVKIGDVSFKTADYLYLASKAIVNLKDGNKKDIPVRILKNPSNPKSAKDLGYLKNYLSVAKKVVKNAESKGKLPNSVSSNVGNIGYKGIVKAFSTVLKYYSSHKKMPSYISVKSLSKSSSSSAGAQNVKNSIKDLSAYLAASHNCQVNDAKIKKLVAKLTKDCKSERQKALAIYNYVRDTISYSFYYDTKYGATGTLKAKTGNCVDHAHLVVAMSRCAGLPARYVHGTCHFSSGGTYGHVWAQILIGDTWTVADATSSRNSLGKVVNWNTNSYSLKGHFSGILF